MFQHVLVAGPFFHGYVRQISRAFRRQVRKVSTVEYLPNTYRALFQNKLILLSSKHQNHFHSNEERHDHQALIRYLDSTIAIWRKQKPDLLFVMRPDLWPAEFALELRHLNPRGAIAFWFYDPLDRYPAQASNLKESDAVFVYDKRDTSSPTAWNNNTFYLPLGFDSGTYRSDCKSNSIAYDLSFVGRITPARVDDLTEALRFLETLPGRSAIYGGKALLAVRLMQWFRVEKPPLYGFVRRSDINARAANHLYQRSRFSLNIHQEGTACGYNPRFFEINGAGGFQVARYLEGMEEMFEPDREIIYYHDQLELVDKLKFFKDNEMARRKIAYSGAARAHKEHTMALRIAQALNCLRKR